MKIASPSEFTLGTVYSLSAEPVLGEASRFVQPRIIAVDGPSSSGKSTISQKIATILGCSFLETGAMYRAVAYFFKTKNFDFSHYVAVSNETWQSLLAEFSCSISLDPQSRKVIVNGQDITAELRSTEVTSTVSLVASNSFVREKLVNMQRSLVLGCELAIVEGRDIGTVVFPDASKKIFLTASVAERAKRRAFQETHKDIAIVQREIEYRDQLDSTREISPLCPAQDAVIVDVSNMTFEQSVTKILDIVTNEHAPVL